MKYDIPTILGQSTVTLTKDEIMKVVDDRYNRTVAHLLALNNPWYTTDDKDILSLEDKFWGSVLKILANRGKISTESESILTTVIDGRFVYEIYFEKLIDKLYEMKKIHVSITGIHMYLSKHAESEFVRKRKYRILLLVPYILEKYVDSQIQYVWDILQYRISGKTILEHIVEKNNLRRIEKRLGEEMYSMFVEKLIEIMKTVNRVSLSEIRRSTVLKLLSTFQENLKQATVWYVEQ